MRKPSILFINRVYPPVRGATGRILRDLARAFAREGWKVTVLTGPSDTDDRENDGAITLLRMQGKEKPSNILGYAWLWLKFLYAGLRAPRTDVVVTLSDPPMLASAGRIIKKIKKNRHIHWCQDLYPDVFPSLGTHFPSFIMDRLKKSGRKALVNADKVIVIGRCMARNVATSGIEPKNISFIPNWPDFELSRPPKVKGVLQIPDVPGAKPPEAQVMNGPKFRVLYAGNIGRLHPVEIILDAAAILDEQHPEIEFTFVGDGPRFEYIARERSRRGLHNIRLMPFQPKNKLREVMESGDVHLISLKEDALGMAVPCKIYPAFAVARPSIFIGPDDSEVAQVIRDFNAGTVVAQDRPQDLAAAIKHLRLSGEAWHAAYEGAMAAGNVFVPKESIDAWIQRAWNVVEQDIRKENYKNAA